LRRLNTLFVGQVLIDLPELDSTNSYAFSLLSKDKPVEGTVISTACQTAGKGQVGNSWESEPHRNITMSVVLFPGFLPLRQQVFLNMAVSLSAHDLLSACIPTGTSIKWPNDLYVGDRKAGGILIQNTTYNNYIRATVAGIGLNVNQTDFSAELPNPTSIRLETALDFDRNQLLLILCEYIEQRYLQLKAGHFRMLKEEYLRNLYRFGQAAWYRRASGEVFEATITDVDDHGRLCLQSGANMERFDLKAIGFL
jgi:BirA family biotin operon repressor/biotin-[acetyl-CoA-carboxylase] ligase